MGVSSEREFHAQKRSFIERQCCSMNFIATTIQTLSDAERRYALIENEMLAVVHGLETKPPTYGRHIRIITDHKPAASC